MSDKNHKKEVKKRFLEIERSIGKSLEVSEKDLRSKKAERNISKATFNLIDIKEKYNNIMSRDFDMESVSESLPIESLKDLQEIETIGKSDKFQYSDLIEASSLKKEADKIIESRGTLLHEQKMSQIELLEAKIKELTKMSEKL